MSLTDRLVRFIQSQGGPRSRWWLGAFALMLLGTGVAALGVPASLPDPIDLPIRQISEPPSEHMGPGRLANAFVLYQTEMTRRGDTVQALLSRLGVDDQEARNFLSSDATARTLLLGDSGKVVSVETEADKRLLKLTAKWVARDKSVGVKLVIERTTDGFRSNLTQAFVQRVMVFGSGVVRSSLFAATDAASVPDEIAVQMAEAFSSDVDFRRELRQGARFSLVYDVLQLEGETLQPGQLLGAELQIGDRSHRVMWHQGQDGKTGFFDLNGQSRRRMFLSSPVAYSRVTSGYGMRSHPVLGGRRAHQGTDYGAPHGTPVRSVADGTVLFSGWKGGYGNYVVIRHDKQTETAYAHLSQIAVRNGQKVTQGQLLGAVGATGTATGPNLHFEYVVRGVRQDPLQLALRPGLQKSDPSPANAEFKAAASEMGLLLSQASSVTQARAQ